MNTTPTNGGQTTTTAATATTTMNQTTTPTTDGNIFWHFFLLKEIWICNSIFSNSKYSHTDCSIPLTLTADQISLLQTVINLLGNQAVTALLNSTLNGTLVSIRVDGNNITLCLAQLLGDSEISDALNDLTSDLGPLLSGLLGGKWIAANGTILRCFMMQLFRIRPYLLQQFY